MFYFLAQALADNHIVFNVFRYITFRAIMASITSFLFCLLLGPSIIRKLSRWGCAHDSRKPFTEAIHEWAKTKERVPTMGGVLIIASLILSLFLWGNLFNRFVIWIIFITLWFGFIGAVDDVIKITRRNSTGLRSKTKFLGQLALGVVLGFYLYRYPHGALGISIPFLKNVFLPLGIFYVPFVVLVVTG